MVGTSASVVPCAPGASPSHRRSGGEGSPVSFPAPSTNEAADAARQTAEISTNARMIVSSPQSLFRYQTHRLNQRFEDAPPVRRAENLFAGAFRVRHQAHHIEVGVGDPGDIGDRA